MVKETKTGSNAIHLASLNGHLNIVKHLIGFTDAPLAPNNYGGTPIYCAALNGNLETVKFLVGLTKTPNAPNNYGKTPTSVAKNAEIRRILQPFMCSKKHNNGSSTKTSTK